MRQLDARFIANLLRAERNEPQRQLAKESSGRDFGAAGHADRSAVFEEASRRPVGVLSCGSAARTCLED